MIKDAFHITEYEIEVFCPQCGSRNVTVDYISGFFTFLECLKCGFKKGNNSNSKNKIER